MRIIDIETFPAEAEAYSYVRRILQNSYSLVDGKLEHHEWRQNFSEAHMAVAWISSDYFESLLLPQ